MDMLSVSNLVLAAGTLVTGLMAGLFFSFSVAIIPGLTRLPDAGYLQSFQSINAAILNPVFLICFMAPLILLPAATWMQYKQDSSAAWTWALAGAILYIVTVFGVTIAGNVPLNDAMAKADLANASAQQLAVHRAAFEPSWNKLHTIRTVANILSFACLIIACFFTRNSLLR
jgi:uncharacterized membrane protein